MGIEAFELSPEALGGLVALVEARTISFGAAKDQVFPALLAGEGSAEAIVAAKGLAQVRDRSAIEALVAVVLAANPGPVAQIRGGKESLKGFLVGLVLKAGGGKVDPALVQEVLGEALAKNALSPDPGA
jgi:aspartyl-tRNA(Asn)/glutamyl-tRNA(Gln) amidotransferase subunit B